MPVVAMHPVEPPSVEGAKVPYPVSEQPAEDSPLYKTDEFRMYCFKVLPCSKRYVHDWTVCPFAHPGEKAKRRDPRVFTYTGVACPDMKKCQRGDACPYAHNVFEYWMHPSRYRTQLCNDGIGCKRKVCFFAHTLEELRVSNVKLLPSDIAAGAEAGSFDLDPFRTARSDSSRGSSKSATSSTSSGAATAGNEALMEALRAQQQQQQAKKAAVIMQRTASRGLAAEFQQLQALQQLQAVLASTQGLGVLQRQVQQQTPVDALVGAMMTQMHLGGNANSHAAVQQLGAATPGLLDAVVQQAVQQAISKNAAQQAAAAYLLMQQQAAAVAQQQQDEQTAQAQALLGHLLQLQQVQHEGGPPGQHAIQAALAALQQQSQALPQHSLGPLPYKGQGSSPMPIPGIGALQNAPVHPLGPTTQHAAGSQSSPPSSGMPASLRSSGTGMAVNGAAPSGGLNTGAHADNCHSLGAPSSPRSFATGSSAGSPALEPTFSGAQAQSVAAAAASYYSQEVSRSSFESYRSSEFELGLQLSSGQQCSGPLSSGGTRSSLDLLPPIPHQRQTPFLHNCDMVFTGALPSPCSPVQPPPASHEEAIFRQEVRNRQMLMAAAAQAANEAKVAPMGGIGAGSVHGGPVMQGLLAEQVAMAAFAGHCSVAPFSI